MNKAFLREPDAVDERCPRCGAPGQAVPRALVAAQVRQPDELRIADVANFCATPTCPVVYFDGFERIVTVDALARPIYPKDPNAPICACFGLTRDDIELDLAEGVVTRTKACVLRAQSPEAQCAERAPNGRSCVAEVQRLYRRLKER